MTTIRFRVVSGALLVAASTATILLTAACSGTATVAAKGSTATVHWTAVQDVPAGQASPAPSTQANTSGSGNAQQTGGNEPVSQQKLLFPDTSFTAFIQSYDATKQMIVFQVVDFQPGGPDDGSFVPDPNRPGIYRLPVTDSAEITGKIALCPEIDKPMVVGVSCDRNDLVQQLQAGRQGYADVHVDATDHIDTVTERYHP